MEQDLLFGIVAFSSLLAVYNPLSAVPMFVAMTSELEPAERKKTAITGVLGSMVFLIAFAFAGASILRFFGITTEAFQIAGGVIFFGIGSDMLEGKRSRVKTTKAEQAEASSRESMAIIPIALPTLAGPGSMVTVIALNGQAVTPLQTTSLYVAILLVGAVTLPVLLLAPLLIAALGRTGLNVVTRIMGLLVMVVGVQFVIHGVGTVLAGWGFVAGG